MTPDQHSNHHLNREQHNDPLSYHGCHLLSGFPTFGQILNSSTQARICLVSIMICITVTNTVLDMIQMQKNRQLINRTAHDRHHRNTIVLEAHLPSILGICALVTYNCPRLYSLVGIFASFYFGLCALGMARMTFDYFGGLTRCSEKLLQKNIKIKLQAFPLTYLFCCLPEINPSKKTLVWIKLGVQQTIFSAIICTFIPPALVLDGTVCENGAQKSFVEIISWVVHGVDIISCLICMTCLGILGNSTHGLLAGQKLNDRFLIYKFCLYIFRLQPAILQIFKNYANLT